MHANGLPFRCLVGDEQREINANDVWNAWCDALALLLAHGLDGKLPQRTLDAMGHKPVRRTVGGLRYREGNA